MCVFDACLVPFVTSSSGSYYFVRIISLDDRCFALDSAICSHNDIDTLLNLKWITMDFRMICTCSIYIKTSCIAYTNSEQTNVVLLFNTRNSGENIFILTHCHLLICIMIRIIDVRMWVCVWYTRLSLTGNDRLW